MEILSKAGYALLDDSASYLYDDESGFRSTVPIRGGSLFLRSGRDYLGALEDFTIGFGTTPLCHVILWETGVEPVLIYQSGVHRFDGSL